RSDLVHNGSRVVEVAAIDRKPLKGVVDRIVLLDASSGQKVPCLEGRPLDVVRVFLRKEVEG
ncbi:MAG: hypothetical protein ACRCW4_11455, partial [Candidatus Neomicrothrix subdominans]